MVGVGWEWRMEGTTVPPRGSAVSHRASGGQRLDPKAPHVHGGGTAGADKHAVISGVTSTRFLLDMFWRR